MGYDDSLDRTQKAMEDLFQAPSPATSAAATVALSLLAGLLLSGLTLQASTLVEGLVLFAAPGLAAALLGWVWYRAVGGVAYLRRTLLLALVGVGLQVLVVGVFLATDPWHAVPPIHAFVLSAAFPLWLRYQVATAISTPDPPRALPDTVSHYALSLLALGLVAPVPWSLAAVLGAVFLAAGAAVVESMRVLTRDEFGADLIALNSAILEHISEGGDAGRAVLERFFSDQGIQAEVPVSTVTFHDDDGLRSALVVPAAHPGPFGTLGGSDLPRRIREALDVPVVSLHGPCTHEQNPVDAAATERVVQAVSEMIEEAEPRGGAAPPLRIPEAVMVQPMGPGGLVVHAPAPQRWDDVDLPTGRMVLEEARSAGLEMPVLADAHHCTAPGVTTVHHSSARARRLREAAADATRKAVDVDEGPLRVGMAADRSFGVDDGLGPEGVQALVVEADGHRTAYVVFDANNMLPGVRDAVRDALLGLVDEAEVLTTDNHVVHAGMDGYNPIGHAHGGDVWVPVARDLVTEALEGMADVRCDVRTREVTLRVFGPGTASRIGTLINLSTIAARRMMVVTFVAAAAIGSLVTLLI